LGVWEESITIGIQPTQQDYLQISDCGFMPHEPPNTTQKDFDFGLA
jgi:hypothetical protein